jgi:pantothenate kinase
MLKLRIIKVNQENYKISIDNNIWGRKKAGFKDWEIGDYLLFVVENKVLGLAQVSGKPFISEDIYWEDDLYPNRITIKVIKTFNVDKGISYSDKIKPVLLEEWGNNYGWQILTQQYMTGKNAEKILELVK